MPTAPPDAQQSAGPVPGPVPVPPAPIPPVKPKTRASLTTMAERRARNARVIELRTANVPISLIAKTLGIKETQVRRVINDHFNANADWTSTSNLARKQERERQLEQIDAQVMRAVMIDPAVLMGLAAPPAGVSVPTISFKDWLQAVEVSRRLKQDLIRLHGLDGATVMTDKQDRTQPGDEVHRAKAIREFLVGLRDADPKLYDAVLTAYDAMDHGEDEDDLPLPGGDDDDGE